MSEEKPVKLHLDRDIPPRLLARRGAISFASYPRDICKPRFERRGGISYDRTDERAIYVRMLGDVKQGRLLKKLTLKERRCSYFEGDTKILDMLSLDNYTAHYDEKFHSLRSATLRKRTSLDQMTSETSTVVNDGYNKQAKNMLSRLGSWDFNMFHLDKLTNGQSLYYTSLQLFQEYGLLTAFNIDIIKLMKCFSSIETGYHSNPYHNSVHAADVTQAMHCYLTEDKMCSYSPLEKMTALLAAMTHDLDHPGVNQSFLIATSNHLAALYKNQSVLENHHWRSAIAVIHESGVFDHLQPEQWSSVECQLKSLILATDITRQQEFLTKFRQHLDNQDLDLPNNEQHRHFILQIALKCADICNPCRNWDLSQKWSTSICQEFFQQGDIERELNIPVTPFCDKLSTTTAKIQVGFMQYVVSPLFKEWMSFLPSDLSKCMYDNIHENKTKWEQIINESNNKGENHSNADPPVEADRPIEPASQCHTIPEDELLEADVIQYITQSMMRRHSLPPVVPRWEPTSTSYLNRRRQSCPYSSTEYSPDLSQVNRLSRSRSPSSCTSSPLPRISTLSPSFDTSLLLATTETTEGRTDSGERQLPMSFSSLAPNVDSLTHKHNKSKTFHHTNADGLLNEDILRSHFAGHSIPLLFKVPGDVDLEGGFLGGGFPNHKRPRSMSVEYAQNNSTNKEVPITRRSFSGDSSLLHAEVSLFSMLGSLDHELAAQTHGLAAQTHGLAAQTHGLTNATLNKLKTQLNIPKYGDIVTTDNL